MKEIKLTLERSIFVGERLEKNLLNMSMTAFIIMVMGVVMALVNIVQGQYLVAVSPLMIFTAALISYISVKKYRNRNLCIIITTVSVILVLTYDVLFVENGFAYLWTLLVPLSVSYMFSVRTGIFITVYFELLFIAAFYGPLKDLVRTHYSPIVMTRFPLLYFFHGLLVLYIMYQYHKSVLFEIDYADRLNEEVKKQTAVAEERSQRIEQMSFQTIQTLANAIDAKDPYTKGHSTRVSQYSILIAEALGWEKERISDLRYAALLHDIGKIGVPDSILNKPSRLRDVEYDIIKSHTTIGAEILRNRILIGEAEDVAHSHHERYDGKGYPRGLKGEEISEEARIVAISDAFDAMNSDRIYRKACDPEHIRNEMIAGKGRQFDPHYTDIFIDLWDHGLLKSEPADEPADEDENMALSSALLRELMASFLSRSSDPSEPDKGDIADADKLVSDIRLSGNYEGALELEYHQFAKLYDFIGNLEKRFGQSYKLVVISFETDGAEEPQMRELDKAMFYMEHSIRQTIRNVDVLTRCGTRQFLIILLGTDDEGVKSAVSRIFRGYYKMNGSSAFSPLYKVI